MDIDTDTELDQQRHRGFISYDDDQATLHQLYSGVLQLVKSSCIGIRRLTISRKISSLDYVRQISEIDTLEHLQIPLHQTILLEGVQLVSRMSKLTTLNLVSTQINESLLQQALPLLKTLSNLKKLGLKSRTCQRKQRNLTLKNVPALRKLPSLKFLHLQQLYISDESARQIGSFLSYLQALSISNCDIDVTLLPEILKQVKSLQSFQYINYQGNYVLTNKLLKSLSSLKRLSICEYKNLAGSSKGAQSLEEAISTCHPGLQQLQIYKYSCKCQNFKLLAKGLKGLKSLSICTSKYVGSTQNIPPQREEMGMISEAMVRCLAIHTPSIRSLKLNRCPLSSQALKAIGECLCVLEQLYVNDCNIGDGGSIYIGKLRNLQVLAIKNKKIQLEMLLRLLRNVKKAKVVLLLNHWDRYEAKRHRRNIRLARQTKMNSRKDE